MFVVVKPCQNCQSFVLKPKKKIKINFDEIQKELNNRNFRTIAYTGSLLSVEKECKINIYNSGKIVIITRNQEYIETIKKEFSSILYPYTQVD